MQTVLDYRTEQLNHIQQKAAIEEQKRLSILRRIQEYDALIEQSFRDQQALFQQGTLDLTQAQSFPDYVLRLKQYRFQEFGALQAQERQLVAIRNDLKQAHIRKKSLEVLKDKDYTRYQKQVEKVEEEFLAEIALMRSQKIRSFG